MILILGVTNSELIQTLILNWKMERGALFSGSYATNMQYETKYYTFIVLRELLSYGISEDELEDNSGMCVLNMVRVLHCALTVPLLLFLEH